MTINDLLNTTLLKPKQKDMVSKVLTCFPQEEETLNITLANFDLKEVEKHFQQGENSFLIFKERASRALLCIRTEASISFSCSEKDIPFMSTLNIKEDCVSADVWQAVGTNAEHEYKIKDDKLIHELILSTYPGIEQGYTQEEVQL